MTYVACRLPLRRELLAHQGENPHPVRPRQRKAAKPPHKSAQRAGWLLWLVKRMTLQDAAITLGLTYKTAWSIYHGFTHANVEPQQPPEDVWHKTTT